MDQYARQLARHLGVPTIRTDIFSVAAGVFGLPAASWLAWRIAREDWRFVAMLNRQGSILHFPNQHLGRYGFFTKKPFIITVHDLIRQSDLAEPTALIQKPNLRDRLYLSLDSRGIRKAARIIAVSEATKRDLIERMNISQERIDVVHEGIDHGIFRPNEGKTVDYPYILYLGSEHPRKNFGTLLRAFAKLKQDGGFGELKLVEVGSAGRLEEYFRRPSIRTIRALGLDSEIVFVEHVSDGDLAAYYTGAVCLVLPSLAEGFGFTPLEAMASGTPAIISNLPALIETSGPASVVIDPTDVDGVAGAMNVFLTDGLFRNEMILAPERFPQRERRSPARNPRSGSRPRGSLRRRRCRTRQRIDRRVAPRPPAPQMTQNAAIRLISSHPRARRARYNRRSEHLCCQPKCPSNAQMRPNSPTS